MAICSARTTWTPSKGQVCLKSERETSPSCVCAHTTKSSPFCSGVPSGAEPFSYNHMGSLAYIGADKGVVDLGRPVQYGEIGPVRGWLMGLTVTQLLSFSCVWPGPLLILPSSDVG